MTKKQKLDILGYIVILGCLITLGAMLYGAYKIDQSHGISVSQSLHNNGL